MHPLSHSHTHTSSHPQDRRFQTYLLDADRMRTRLLETMAGAGVALPPVPNVNYFGELPHPTRFSLDGASSVGQLLDLGDKVRGSWISPTNKGVLTRRRRAAAWHAVQGRPACSWNCNSLTDRILDLQRQPALPLPPHHTHTHTPFALVRRPACWGAPRRLATTR